MKAHAAALVEAFYEQGISRPDAAKDIASALKQCGFPIEHDAVLKWYKGRKKANKPFLDIYDETLALIHEHQAAFPTRSAAASKNIG